MDDTRHSMWDFAYGGGALILIPLSCIVYGMRTLYTRDHVYGRYV